jgi:hypothetical protein
MDAEIIPYSWMADLGLGPKTDTYILVLAPIFPYGKKRIQLGGGLF